MAKSGGERSSAWQQREQARLFGSGIKKSDPVIGTGALDADVLNGADSEKNNGGLCYRDAEWMFGDSAVSRSLNLTTTASSWMCQYSSVR